MGDSSILVIDDDPLFRTVTSKMLRSARYSIVKQGEAWSALELLGKAPHPSLICLDLMLPGVSGLELCERIRAAPLLRQVPILVITARATPRTSGGHRAGADAILVKPVRRATLLRVVEKLIAGAAEPSSGEPPGRRAR